MRFMRSARWLLLALVVMVIPVSSHAGVLISVNFGPPVLPVYVQPDCPGPGLMWTPGYWAYGPDGYYWVPGAWVPAPYEGALWTPGYWGWSGGMFIFHDGYWGPHVGYYGGVNYGFGYGGIGFAGGEWRGHVFAYNTAVMHVDRRYVHETFEDRARVERSIVARDNRVAYSGGPGGIHHEPGPEERMAERDQHVTATRFQQQHMQTAMSDRTSYAKNNGGRPSHVAAERPLQSETHAAPMSHGAQNNGAAMHGAANGEARPQPGRTPTAATHNTPPAMHQAPASHEPASNFHQPPAAHATPQSRPAAAPHPQAQSRPESHSEPAAHSGSKDEHKH